MAKEIRVSPKLASLIEESRARLEVICRMARRVRMERVIFLRVCIISKYTFCG